MAGHAQFSPPQVIVQGSVTNPQRVDTIDFDHDSDLDLLVFCLRENRVMLARNQGAGTFEEPEELLRTTWPMGAAALADMNGDGQRDLLLCSDEYEGWLSLFLNIGGVFGPEQVVLSANVLSIHAMDVDSDGYMDILANDNDAIFWMAGNGSGSFGPRQDLVIQISAMSLSVADMDQDGLEDLVHVDSGHLGWHRNLGGGVLQNMGEVSIYNDVLPPICGDLDNDGDLDVIVLCGAEIVSFLLDATMTLVLDAELIGIPYASSKGAVLIDLNDDELPELVFGGYNRNQLILLPNLGGGFGAPVIIDDEAPFMNFVTAGDLDGNGTMDVIHARTANSMAEVGWNLGNGMGSLGPTTPVMGSGPPYPWKAAATDVDQDGDQDVIVISWYPSPASPTTEIYLFKNLGAGHFDQGQFLFSGVFEPFYGKHLELQDLNADGYEDIVLASTPGPSVLMNDGVGGFALSATLTSAGVKDITLADVNGDASPDLVIATEHGLEWSSNDGLGGFGPTQLVVPISDTCDFILSRDVDGDGDMDMLAVTTDHLQILLFRNTGGGAFGPREVVIEETFVAGPLALEDLDGDGDLDLVYRGSNGTRWSPNDGTGAWGAAMPVSTGPYWILADVDQDDDVDLVYGTIGNPDLGGLGDGLLYWRSNSGTGEFGSAQVFAANQSGNGPMAVADMDGDGDTDVIVTFWSHARIAWYENHVESPYRIEGTVFMDADLNGSYGSGDIPFPYAPVSITPMLSTVMSGASGTYTAFVDTGSFVLESALPNPLWILTTIPPVQSVQVTTLVPQVTGIDFGWAPVIDTSIVLPGFTLGPAPCAGTAHSWLSYVNQGTRIEQGTITLELDPLFTFISSSPSPSLIAGNTLTWDFDSLAWFDFGQITMDIELPPVGSDWTNITTVTTVDDQGNATGIFTLEQSGIVGCAYDPNDKQVEPQGYGIHGAVPIDTESLTYTIHFQNTGTDTAYHVIIVDRLEDNLDPASLQILGTSHDMSTLQIDADGEAIFRFDNIMLPDSNVNVSASQGYLRFRIRPSEGAPHGSLISNTASIFFDLNPAVITNTVCNTLVDCNLFTAFVSVPQEDLLIANVGAHYQWFLNGDSIPGATNQFWPITVQGSYSVRVTSEYGCVAMSTPYQVVALGAPSDVSDKMLVVPNPADEDFTIFLSEALGVNDKVELLDEQGRVQRSYGSHGGREVHITRHGLQAGMYLLRITGSFRSPLTAKVMLL